MIIKMTDTCPKCNSQIELDPAVIPAEGLFKQCSECHVNFTIRKESFAKRAIHKGDEISCAECGEHPGSSICCQSCHAIYPDFMVIEISSAAKKQIGKILSFFNILKTIKIGGSVEPSTESYKLSPSKTGKGKGLKLLGKPVQLAAVIALILLLSAGGGYYWYQNNLATKYSENYVRALLGIKAARDLNIKISSRLVADMKTGGLPTLTAAEQKAATSAKTDVSTLIQRLGKTPDKFTASNNAIKNLNESFLMLHATVTSPAGMADTYSAAVKQMDDAFKKSSSTLKAGLPERISIQLSESTKKYKQLQDF